MPREDRAAARRLALRKILERGAAGSQLELLEHLARAGYAVTQTTVSRDLGALGARRVRRGDGWRYELRRARHAEDGALRDRLGAFVTAIEASGNLVVIGTEPGAAGTVADALDHAALDGVLGSVAGDDTIFVATRAPRGGAALARQLRTILEGAA